MARPPTGPVVAFESQAAWEAWLAEHHATSSGVWVKIAKKASGIPTVTHAEALETALCYGWIDGQRNRFDDRWFLQRFTPRRSRSNWSKINRAKAEQLIGEGRMQPAGLREIERARADGRWDAAHDAPSAVTVAQGASVSMDAATAIRNTHEWFEVNSGWAPPDEDELAEWLADGVCRCPDECLVAPEGWCAHGLASWWLIIRALDAER